ncbi:hypothetical protein E1258_03105 [Micromonospora sp. KC207]|uniref:hypothetical protein n=1 Tax=Micromonospora sp. KC207 TaxID=2530377 RepID=UPI001044C65A|nr:hypothetical protein [Micromonospora sp. KC207]TDC66335.1 hypothetical protein E1258_03105 [Micromonospora sp. KC207]
MDQGGPVASPGRAWRWWGALRLALVLLWLLAAVTTWWTAPRKQSYDQARADVAAGRVTAYQWGDRWGVGSSPRWFGTPALQGSGTLGPLIAWRTPDGRVHWTDTDIFGQVTTTGAVDQGSYSGPGAVGIAQDLRAAGLEHRAGVVPSPASAVTWIDLFLAAVVLGVVVAGPAPVRGTRWFWFWLIYLTPHGLGLLFWLARDHPWSRPAVPAAARSRVERRHSGILGFGIGILAAMLIGAVLLILRQALGDWWVPRPDASHHT